MSDIQILALIKFGNEEHLERLFNHGELYCSPLQLFGQLNENERGDGYEGAYSIENVNLVDVKCEHPTFGTFHFKPVANQKSQITLYNDDPILIFSAYAITKDTFQESNNHTISENMTAFGDSAIMIQDIGRFRKSIYAALQKEQIIFKEDIVKYHDYSAIEKRDLSHFDKSDTFKHQQEYRILFATDNPAPRIIKIDPLKEYSLMTSSKIMTEFEWNVKRRAIDQ